MGFTEKDLSLKQSTATPTPTDYSDEPHSPPRKKIFRASKPIVARAYHADSITSSPYEGTPDLGSEQPHSDVQTSSGPSSSADEDGDESDNAMRTDGRSTTISSHWSFLKPSEHVKSGSFIPATPVSPTRMSSEKPRKPSNVKNTEANEMLLDMMKRGYTVQDIRDEWKRTTGYETSDVAWRSRYYRLNAKGLTGGVQLFIHPNREVMNTEDDAGSHDPVRIKRFCAVNSRHPPGTTSYYKQASSTPAPLPKPSLQDPARQASELSTRETIEAPSLADAEAGAQSSSNIYSHLMTPIATPVAASSAMDISSGPFTLAPNKLARTTLRIADSNTYTPLKLRSCADISALFSKVLDICGLTDRKDAVEALKLTFEWVPEADEERNMLLKERYEDSFEFFLEMVDEAPCWAEGKKCTVGVEVVLKDKEEEKEGRMGSLKRRFSKTTEGESSRKSSSVGEQSDRKPSSSGEQMDYQTSATRDQDHREASSVADVTLEEMET